MKLLFITDLYPEYPDQSRIDQSYAIHDLIKNYKNTSDIVVVRPVILKNPFKIFRNKKMSDFTLDGIRVFNCPVFKIPKFPVFFIGNIVRCLDLIKFKPDMVSAHLGFNLQIGYMISLDLNIPLLSGIHMGDLLYTPNMTGDKNFNKILSHSSGLACRSDLIKKNTLIRFPQYEKKVFTAFSGIEEKHILSRDRFISKYKQWPDDPSLKTKIITVCRLDRNKNVDKILRELSLIDEKYKWEYTIVGEGKEKDRLKKIVKKKKLEGRVSFTGKLQRDDVLKILEDTNIFILQSSVETFGIVFMEAMAKANIVIGTKNTGIDGFIINGFNGFLVNPGNIGELSEVLTGIMSRSEPEEIEKILNNIYNKIIVSTAKKATENYFVELDYILNNTE